MGAGYRNVIGIPGGIKNAELMKVLQVCPVPQGGWQCGGTAGALCRDGGRHLFGAISRLGTHPEALQCFALP